jgi:hypothetical protein
LDCSEQNCGRRPIQRLGKTAEWSNQWSAYVAGGSHDGRTSKPPFTESFNLSTNKWTTLAGFYSESCAAADSAVSKCLLCCFNGDNTAAFQGKVFNFVQIYQP